MKSWHRIGILFGALALLPATALADNSNWYAAGYLGQSHLNGGGGPAQQWMNQAQNGYATLSPPSVRDYSDSESGYRFTVGYVFNWNWGIEGGYVDLGKPTAIGKNAINTGSGTGGLTCGLPCNFSYNIDTNATLKATGWTVVINGTYPIADDNSWALYGRAGVMDAHVTLDITTAATNSTPVGTPGKPKDIATSSTGLKTTYGFGIKVTLDDNWSMRFGWDKYSNLGDSGTTSTYGMSLTSLGLVYRF